MALSLTATPSKNERFYIQCNDELIEITVCRHGNSNKVRILFEASKSVVIDREKVYLNKTQG
jgi:sRNA-binding carbon storage regulator CsrA